MQAARLRGFRVVAFTLLLATLRLIAPACSAEPTEAEKTAAATLRKVATNLQFNKDGTARLIRLSKTSVSDEHLEPLRELRQLDYVAIVSSQVTDAGIAHLADLTKLDTLLLSESGVTDAGLSSLRKLAKLERLYLADTEISDAGLAKLSGLTSLTTLSLRRTNVSDAGLVHLSGLVNLETLLLAGTSISDEGLKTLAGLPKLKLLDLSECRLTPEGLAQLKGLEQLEHLSLNGCQFKGDSLKHLTGLSQIKQIELYDTNLSLDAIANLRTELPKTLVHAQPVKRAPQAGVLNSSVGSAAVKPILAPIRDRLDDKNLQPDLQRHVVAVLGRLGCNGRACHGSFQGQGDFQLSMFGYDFGVDHKNLIERIDRDAPAKSLILNKPTSADDHEGGKRLVAGGWEQTLLRRWIEAGAPRVANDAPKFERLEVSPAEVVFQKTGETVALRAVAVWSDGTREDVTGLSRFETKNETVATVTVDGVIASIDPGDTFVIVYYDNGIVATPVMRAVSDKTGDRFPKIATPTKIDALVAEKLKKLGIVPSALSSDAEFLRRVSLDLVGSLPTPEEITSFTADTSSDKRAAKVEELLARPAYVTWWTTRLCDLTGSNAGYLGATEMAQPVAAQWRAWIERRVSENVGWDKIVEGLLLARSRRPGQSYQDFITQGSGYTRRQNPDDFASLDNSMPHYWFRDNLKASRDKVLSFGYTFLGVRLNCAECHKHPFDQWSQQDFEQFKIFFERVRTGVAPDAKAHFEETRSMLGVPVKLDTAALRRQSYLRVAAEGRPIPWQEVFIAPPIAKPQPAKLLGGATMDLNEYDDPREPLMDWLRNEPNHYLARAFVNRIWANYFNVGIIDPPDDLNLANPPSNRALLDYLVEDFIKHGYDMKWLHRTVVSSHTYQRTWRPNRTNLKDERNFSHAIVRRLPAEVAIDAIAQSTVNDAKLAGAHDLVAQRKIGQHPKSFQTRSIDFSLLIFGKPLRTTNCDCERKNEPTLLQSLYVRNDAETLQSLTRADSWFSQLKTEKATATRTDEVIRSAYLRTLSRLPSESEVQTGREHIESSGSLLEGLEDLLWALINTQEFITNH